MAKFKKNKVLQANNLPSRLPVWSAITCWLALDHWNAPQWAYGAMGLFFIIMYVVFFIALFTEDRIDLLKNDKEK